MKRTASLILVGLFVWVTGCYNYAPIPIGPGEVADQVEVRVTLTSGQRVALRDPVVEADSIRGRRDPDSEIAIPLDQVTTIEGKELDAAKTATVTVGVVVGVVVIATLDAANDAFDDWMR